MFAAAIRKDLQLLARDRGALVSLFLLPVAFIVVFGLIFGGGGPERRTVSVWAGASPRGQQVVAVIEASQMFKLRKPASADAARADVAADRATAAVILPDDFDPAAGHPAELAIDEVLDPRARMPVEGGLDAIIRRTVFPPAPGSERPVLVPRTPPGVDRSMRDVSMFQLTVPGNAVLFGFFLALTVGLAFSEERRWGTWRRILAAPVSRASVLLAKLVPYFLVGLGQFVFLFGLGTLAFGMRVGGSWLALAALTVAVVICATSLGLLFAAVGGSEKRMGSIGSVTLLVMGMVGGSMVPRAVMPPTFKAVGLVVPHAWALDGYFKVLVRQGTGLADVVPQIGALLGFAALFAGVGLWRFRFEPR